LTAAARRQVEAFHRDEHRLGGLPSAAGCPARRHYKAGMTPAQIRLQLIGGRTRSIETIIQRAVERGEVDPGRLTARISSLPFDLLRHEAIDDTRARSRMRHL
jgi:Tetracyclin repressor-like, C-terminal domain